MKLALFLLLAALIAAALSHPTGTKPTGSIGTGKGRKLLKVQVQPMSSDDKKRECLATSKVDRTDCETNENVDTGILSKSKKKADPDKLAKCIELEWKSYNACVKGEAKSG